MRYESAELTKTAINLYLFGAVTYANTLADLCEEVGADWSEMAPALRLDRRIGARPPISGRAWAWRAGNLERDLVTLRALCDAHGVDAAYIETLIQYNARRYRWVHRQLERRVLAETARPVVAVWGLAYKKDTRSTKNSMSLRVIDDLRGRAEIRAYDPLVRASEVDVPVTVLADRDATLAGADCLLILTDWDEFAAPPRDAFKAMRRPLVIDCVGVVDPRRTDLGGVEYVSHGSGGGSRAGSGMNRRAVFLDRDGVLVETSVRDNRAYAALSLDEFRLCPEAGRPGRAAAGGRAPAHRLHQSARGRPRRASLRHPRPHARAAAGGGQHRRHLRVSSRRRGRLRVSEAAAGHAARGGGEVGARSRPPPS